ncbi:response regulator [Magnetospira sp. QH-2]|uniref:response regulator n=1 Tax=Magnetospira sp. (strain QH-2) TaxID=1288970 RepID=UPI0003E81B43|nr:response regulator [Magnetospira sp. QH-2]CCQ74335.1 putative Two component signal transduction response regulator [Magnetospira sp. QH-2]
MTTSDHSVRILLVEDNPGDARLTKEAFRAGKVPCEVDHVVNGEEAMAFLRREGSYGDRKKPHMVLLDLNMPRMDGREVLAAMSNDAELKDIPVIALTTSSAPEDIEACYRNGANAYVVKPPEFNSFIEKVRALEAFWFGTASLPEFVAI